ncbi:hypothetical protein [Promicromonospora sp. NFX87]|uniref:hypothetical protein n=1 Tax=Promicromonospora sp. NFX87 TaxID=3402691 RepID=UPI003AFB1E69
MTSDEVTPDPEMVTSRVTPRADDRLYAEDVAAAQGVTTDALLSRLREVEAEHAADPWRCTAPDCEQLLPEDSQADTCSQACRQAQARALRGRRSQAPRDQGPT